MGKWIAAGLVLLGLVIVVGLLARKSVRAEIIIEAPPEEVWSVITDPSRYGEWNPIFVAYDGAFAQGNTLTLQMKVQDGSVSPVEVRVKDFVPYEWMHEGGGYPVMLTYDHNWHLEPVAEGTRVIQHEYYTGLFVLFWDPAWVERAYERGNENLKVLLERDSSSDGSDAMQEDEGT